MSKGNLLFGQARGKVGDLVLTRIAGEQVARARNRAPKNPRTTKQMVQRAMMATLVEFFTQGTRNMFKFAFENKRPGESDYNAFVRANMGRGPVQSAKTIKTNGPVFGSYIMSMGSLPRLVFRFNDVEEFGAIEVGKAGVAGSALTIGKLSQTIIDRYGLQNGDVITIGKVVAGDGRPASTLEAAEEQGALVESYTSTNWHLGQFTLDVASTALVSTLGFFGVAGYTATSETLELNDEGLGSDGWNTGAAVMMFVIVSRPSTAGVKVSTSVAQLNESGNDGEMLGSSDEWKTWVAKHYMESTTFDAKPEDILKGSISKN